MQTKLSVFCDRLIEAGWLAAAAVIPFFFNVYSSRVFEPDKLTLLRCIALIIAAAFIVKTIESMPKNLSLSSRLRSFVTATPLTIPVLIFLTVYFFTTATSIVPAISFWGSYQRLQGTLVNISYITVFFLTAHHLRSKVQLSRLLWVIILDAFAISLYGLIQHSRLDPLPWGGDVTERVTSSMGNAIFLAAYLIMTLPVTLAVLVHRLVSFRAHQLPKGSSRSGSWLASSSVFYPILSLIVGTGFFGFVQKTIQYISFGRGLSKFGSADILVLALGALLTAGGLALVVYKLTSSPSDREFSLGFFLCSALTAIAQVQLAAIIYSQSRGPWIGLAVGFTVFIFLTFLRNRLRLVAAAAGVAIVIGAVFVVLINVNGSPVAGLRSKSPYLARLGSLSSLDEGTNKVRLLIWAGDDIGKGDLGLITADPVRTIIGYGPESMYVAYNRFYPPLLADFEARNASPDRSHNDYLDFIVTMGVIGLASYLAIVATFFYFTVRLLWRSDDRYYQFAMIGFMAAVAGHLAETFVGIAIAATRTHFWLYLAACSALFLMARAKKVVPANGGAPADVRPVAAAVRSAGGRSTTTSRSQRARNRRIQATPTPALHKTSYQFSGWVSFLPLAAYLGVTAVFVISMLLGSWAQQQEARDVIIAGFSWLVVGILLTALWVHRDERPTISWRSSYWWAYSGLIAIVLYIIIQFFLSSIIADTYFKKAQAYDNVGRFDISAHQYLVALDWAPSQDFYYLFLGRAYLELAKIVPDQTSNNIIATLDDLERLDQRQLKGYTREDFFNASLVALKTAKQLNPLNTDNSANLGRLYRFWAESSSDPAKRQDKMNTASQYYSDALTLSPNAAHLYDEWGLVYYEQGKPDEAIAKYQKALSIDKKFATTYTYLGEAYLYTNQLDKAEEMYQASAKLDDNQANVHSALGYIYHSKGMTQEALAEELRAAELTPNDVSVHRELAGLYQELGMLDKALAEAQTALKLAPADQKATFQAFVDDLQKRRSGG